VLAVRLDSMGDVLLTGPAVRALATERDVVYLAGPAGASAAALLPGVAKVEVFSAPWILADPPPVDLPTVRSLVQRLRRMALEAAVVFTSSHQSPLPFALLARLAGIPWIGGISVDYAGGLLDVRIPGDPDVHEVERNLLVARAAGAAPAADDDGALRVQLGRRDDPRPAEAVDYVVVHPGADAPARTWPPARWAELVDRIAQRGRPVIVTGSRTEASLCAEVCGGNHHAHSLAGATDARTLAHVLAGAGVVICGNTGPAHLAATVGTPIVTLFAPTVPARRWYPWMVPHVLLGDQSVPCAGCRSRQCQLPVQICLDGISTQAALDAMESVTRDRLPAASGASA
jgi:ADP-heptose:LPS heptosyltransferase